ncbi:DUF2256 domain-containing protein [Pacificoceanicola onchidii]|uniref:DUF2256 domain-containing protein n=1 Tax=Pacificoceanicola onchidii TaxID=2562685 RepID=UPI001F10438D|nr:DUF2256 domain-containing protein [Pacificoceanicola onchidii]
MAQRIGIEVERSTSLSMKQRKKSDLPSKTCATCGRPFVWRRKWAKVWEEVRYCSERCRRDRQKLRMEG